MAKVTSKRQLTIPKSIADSYAISSGDEVALVPDGDAIRIELGSREKPEENRASRLARFDRATERQLGRQAARPRQATDERGWSREDLYERARAR